MELPEIELLIKKVANEKIELYHKQNKKEISENEFESQFKAVEKEYKKLTYEKIELMKGNFNKKLIEQEKKMENEKVTKEKKARTPRESSQAALIEKALSMKTVKSFDDVGNKVVEWDNSKDKNKVIAMAKNIVKIVEKKSQKRWEPYTWDKEGFQLTKVE